MLLPEEIDIVTVFDKNGNILPVKFKMDTENSSKVIKIDKIIDSIECNLADSDIIVYKCESYIKGIMKPLELHFDKRTFKWYLHKF